MAGDDDTDADDPDEEAPREADDRAELRRKSFPLLLVAVLAVWKTYEAVVADTVQATIAPSLYTIGLGSFAVSLLGPRTLQVVTFFVGAVLCLAAMAFDARP